MPNRLSSEEKTKRWKIIEQAGIHTKKCSKCEIHKSVKEFSFNTCGRDAYDRNGLPFLRPECKSCGSASRRKKPKNVSYPQIGTPCEICHKTAEKLVFDHDHITGLHRGWLCDPCNRSIGVLGDNVERLIRVVNYLNNSEKKVFAVSEFQINIKE